MSELTLQGSLEVLQRQTRIISEIVKYRGSEGWPILQADERWLYETEKDDRVCQICENFGKSRIFRGDSIPIIFPDYKMLNWNIIHPHVHITHPEMEGECRCVMTWQNPAECLEERLHDEKIMAVAI